ncbi:uncharacterized protein FIBRA_06211 [Fibroporia radiculosa]|uniref:DUF4050 domain-containing protein n=1 Tax=Fibroporia radiculosa TaxID=599839 RepID=J4HYR7_9APHY|nr:uncharacterized protein FIBRA_06211 [Fibroporia radiculosa]CCM04052.1 predicted protein [Fibroporia radiculosa]
MTPAAPSSSSFEHRLKSAHMPPPGPAYFHARRALWSVPSPNPPNPTAHTRLEQILNQEGVHENDEVWDAGLATIWRGLTNRTPLKKRLSLNMTTKILMCGWIRDGTWPRGATAPHSDDEQDDLPADAKTYPSTMSNPQSDGL